MLTRLRPNATRTKTIAQDFGRTLPHGQAGVPYPDHPTAPNDVRAPGLRIGSRPFAGHCESHLCPDYGQDYSTIPTIGTLFFLNFVSAVLVAAGLVAPLRRVAGRYADAIRAFFAVSGIGIAVLSLAGLFVSESSGLYGFVEHGYRTAIVLAIVAEVAATLFLVVYPAASGTGIDKLRSRSG